MKKIGDYVIYQEKVCQIKEQKMNEFTKQESYTLIPITDSSLKLTVPINNSKMKELMTKEELKSFLSLIPTISLIETDEKLLENEYKKLFHSGEREDLIKINNTTYHRNQNRLNNNKKISEKDNRYFEMTENLLYSEIAIILNITLEEAKEYVIKEVSLKVN